MIRNSRDILAPASFRELLNEYTMRFGLDLYLAVPDSVFVADGLAREGWPGRQRRMLTILLIVYYSLLYTVDTALRRFHLRPAYVAAGMLGLLFSFAMVQASTHHPQPTQPFDTQQLIKLVTNRLALAMSQREYEQQSDAWGGYALASTPADIPPELFPQVVISAPPMMLTLADMPPDAWTVKTIPQPIAVVELADKDVVIETVSAQPVEAPAPAPLEEGRHYTIQQGDMLWELAQDFGIDFRKIIQYNPAIDPRRMKVGDKVYLPGINDPYKRNDRMIFPIEQRRRITSGYGMRKHPIGGSLRFHKGIDVSARTGTRIISVLDGKVVAAGWHGDLGYAVRIQHADGIRTVYGHCSRLLVKKGQSVLQGQTIALVGRTGRVTGAHLHFEVWKNGKHQNPSRFLPSR